MGLDMYAYAVEKHSDNTDTSIAEGIKREDIAYWRKFNALHGWMEDLYRERNPEAQGDFNCIPLRLTLDDLAMLSLDLINNRLEPRSGFFFGQPEIYPTDIEATGAFIGKAVAAIQSGKDVYYDSWW